ncbi:AbgT family transporter [Vibrio metschnikovii]
MWLKRVMIYHKIKWAFDRCGKERLKIRWICHRRCLRDSLAWTIVPENGVLRHPETGLVAGSSFLRSIVAFIFVFFCCSWLCLR